jgi:hypothetical protein
VHPNRDSRTALVRRGVIVEPFGSDPSDNLIHAVLTWLRMMRWSDVVDSPSAGAPQHVSLGEQLAPGVDRIPTLGQLAGGRHEKLPRPPDS